MKTKFFKKLSFVLVVAMVLSVFAPAASAFAAKKPALNSTKKYLHLGRVDNGQNEFNFNIKNKQKGSKYQWESSNEAIAVVNEKNGVTTAKGVGKATISVTITDKDGKDTTLKAQVIVRDNIETVKISNPVEKVGVGEAYDYNRSFITEAGSTKKTSAITRWEVEPNTATIDDKGVFVATEPGEYTVTALSFQSKARYNSWLEDADKYADYVLDTDTTKVVVAPSIVEVKQVDTKSVKVVFDSAMEDADKKISLYYVVGESKVKQIIDKVKMSDDKKEATVSLYIDFVAGGKYVVEYEGLGSEPFEAATTNVEDVAQIQITTSTVVVNEAKEIEYKLLNAKGVDISTSELRSRVRMQSENEVGTYFDSSKKELTIFEKNTTATITATFHTYEYDNTGKELGALTATAVIMGVDKSVVNITGLSAWTIVEPGSDPNFDDVKQQLAVEDSGFRLFVQYTTSDDNKVSSKDDENKLDFSFTTTDKNVLIIDDDGLLHPIKDDTVAVIVNYGANGSDKTPIGVIPITISPKRDAARLTLNTYSFTLSNNASVGAEKDVEITLKDQLNGDYPFGRNDISVVRIVPASGSNEVVYDRANDKVTFKGTGAEPGDYKYRITVKDLSAVVSIKILDGTEEDGIAGYKLVLSDSEIDTKVTEENKGKVELGIEVFAINKFGAEIENIDLSTNNKIRVQIDAPKSEWSKEKVVAPYALTKAEDSEIVTGKAISKAPVGSYKVTLFETRKVDGKEEYVEVAIRTTNFRVKDTQSKVSRDEIKTRYYETAPGTMSDMTTLISIAKSCFKFTLDGTDVTDNIVHVEAIGKVSEFNIKSVTIKVDVEGSANHLEEKVNVGLTVTQK